MSTLRNETFTERVFILDGAEFVNCIFNRCTLVYEGGVLPIVKDCAFNFCAFQLEGPANRALLFLSFLYSVGGGEIVEGVFTKIRQGAQPTTGSEAEDGSPGQR